METELVKALITELPKLGPTGLVLVGGGWLVWRLGGRINELKEAAFQTKFDSIVEKITLLENKLNAVESALIKLGAWRKE